jgi:hypothetical protein
MSRVLIKAIKDIPEAAELADINTTIAVAGLTNLTLKRYTNIVQNFINTTHVYPSTANRPGTILDVLTTEITTQRSNSKILYNLVMSQEANENAAFYLERVIDGVATELGSGLPAGSRFYGFATPKYDVNDKNSTMLQVNFSFLDNPGVQAGTQISYRVRFYANFVNTLTINRTLGDLNQATYERASSSVILQEITV